MDLLRWPVGIAEFSVIVQAVFIYVLSVADVDLADGLQGRANDLHLARRAGDRQVVPLLFVDTNMGAGGLPLAKEPFITGMSNGYWVRMFSWFWVVCCSSPAG